MKRFFYALALSFAIISAGCCNCPPVCCPAAPSTPDLSSAVDMRQPPDLAVFNPCVDHPCMTNSDCLPSFCRCSKPEGGICSDARRCVYSPCIK